MAYSFPLPLADFFDGLPIESVTPDLTEAVEINRTRGGEVLTADLGPRLWRCDVVVPLGYYAAREKVRAKLRMLRQAGRTLLVHSMPLIGPQYDPKGTILGASIPVIGTVGTNNREMRIDGLPVGYELQTGDFLSFTYGSSPTRYAMHQVVVGGTANGSGQLSIGELVPFIRPGYALGAAVTLIKPVFKAIIEPGSSTAGSSSGGITQGITFSLIQTLR